MIIKNLQLVAKFARIADILGSITTNSASCPPLLLLATFKFHPCHTILSMGNRGAGYIYPAGYVLNQGSWLVIMGKSLMKITSLIRFPGSYRKSAPAKHTPENYGYLCYCRRLLGRQNDKTFCNRSGDKMLRFVHGSTAARGRVQRADITQRPHGVDLMEEC